MIATIKLIAVLVVSFLALVLLMLLAKTGIIGLIISALLGK